MKRLALAIARDRRDLPDIAGTTRFCSRGLAIVHGEAPADVLSPGVATIEAYAALVAAIHERETVLPLRFGSVHDSTSSLDDWLRVRGDEWRSILDDVDGCDEMGLRILLDRTDRREARRYVSPVLGDRPRAGSRASALADLSRPSLVARQVPPGHRAAPNSASWQTVADRTLAALQFRMPGIR